MKSKQFIFLFLFVSTVLIVTLQKKGVFDTTPESKFDEYIWAIQYPKDEKIISKPALYENKLYIQTNATIYAYDYFSGELLWKTKLPIETETGGFSEKPQILVDNQNVIVHSQVNLVSVFDINDGNLIWSSNDPYGVNNFFDGSNTTVLDMALQQGYLLVSRRNESIAAYDVHNGDAVWVSDAPTRTSLEIYPFGETVYVQESTSIILYDLASGDNLGTFPLTGYIVSSYFNKNELYLTFDDGECSVAVFDLKEVRYDWCVKLPQSPFSRYMISEIVDTEYFYVYDDRLRAMDKSTGKLLWSLKANREFEYVGDGSDILLAVDVGYLYLIDKFSGEKIQKIIIPEELLTWDFFAQLIYPPILSEDVILFSTNEQIVQYKLHTNN